VVRIGIALALLLSSTAIAQVPDTRPPFDEWLRGVRSEALERGLRAETVDRALAQVEAPLEVVLERDRTQAETVLSLEQYLDRRLTNSLVRNGRNTYGTHQKTLDTIAARYGVPARVLVSIWGVESNFGRFSGVRPTISALATLAYDPRRATYFRGELFNALEILDRGYIELEHMRGSWAGAMGQPQFMPSSYLQYAADFDGDGHRDIWNSHADVFASIANYLKGHGWVTGERWGREVSMSRETAIRIGGTVPRRQGSCRATRDMTEARPLTEWQALGVRTLSRRALPVSDQMASLVRGERRSFLVYQNYNAILEYNCAHSYALTVALLSDRVTPATAAPTPPPASAR
jgi:membrane-bound lytic murein transglycosylase B